VYKARDSVEPLSAPEHFIAEDCFAPRLDPVQNVCPSLRAITQEQEHEEMGHEDIPSGNYEYQYVAECASPGGIESTSPEHGSVGARRELFETSAAVVDAEEQDLIRSIASATVELPRCDHCGKVRTPFFPSLLFGECVSPQPRDDDEPGSEPNVIPETSSSSDDEVYHEDPGRTLRM
jgi:hypothetical protein